MKFLHRFYRESRSKKKSYFSALVVFGGLAVCCITSRPRRTSPSLPLLFGSIPAASYEDANLARWNPQANAFSTDLQSLPNSTKKTVVFVPIYGLCGKFDQVTLPVEKAAMKLGKARIEAFMLAPPNWTGVQTCETVADQVKASEQAKSWLTNVAILLKEAAKNEHLHIVLLGHSKGGLIATHIIHTAHQLGINLDRVTLVAFNTPFAGASKALCQLANIHPVAKIALRTTGIFEYFGSPALFENLDKEGVQELLAAENRYLTFAQKLPCRGLYFATRYKSLKAVDLILRQVVDQVHGLSNFRRSLCGDFVVDDKSQLARLKAGSRRGKVSTYLHEFSDVKVSHGSVGKDDRYAKKIAREIAREIRKKQ